MTHILQNTCFQKDVANFLQSDITVKQAVLQPNMRPTLPSLLLELQTVTDKVQKKEWMVEIDGFKVADREESRWKRAESGAAYPRSIPARSQQQHKSPKTHNLHTVSSPTQLANLPGSSLTTATTSKVTCEERLIDLCSQSEELLR